MALFKSKASLLLGLLLTGSTWASETALLDMHWLARDQWRAGVSLCENLGQELRVRRWSLNWVLVVVGGAPIGRLLRRYFLNSS